MKRKVIKQGNGTLTITLPKEWTRKVGLKGGEEIDVLENEENLNISFSGRKPGKKKFNIELSKEEMADSRYLEAHLNSLYISGYDKIIIKLPEKKAMNIIQSIIKNNFLGYEISSFENNKCIIDNIANPSDEKFDTILRRLFLMTKKLIEDFYSDIESDTFSNMEFYKEQAKSITLYSNYCLRMIANRINPKQSFYALWSLILRVLQIHNIMIYCYERLPNYKFKISKDTIDLFKGFIELFNMCYELFYGYDITKTKTIHNKYYKTVYPNMYGKFLGRRGGEAFLIYHLGKAIRQILYITYFTISYNTNKK